MKTETYQKKNGAWTWRILEGDEVVRESPKEFPNEHAAQRNLLRVLTRKPSNPIPPASTKAT